MAYATSSVESGSRNRISKHPPNSRVEQVRYYRNPDTNYRYNLGANNNSNKTLLDYSGIDDNLNYDTLDSAYSTSESSYNTVDSSYTQRSNSSGYNTLELKWKEPKAKHGVERLKQVPSNRNSVFNHVSGSFEGELSEGSFKEAELDGIKFADDLDDSDTATETETDTEFTISGCSIDMSYVPDYVRPVMAPVSIATLTSTTSSFTMSRPIITSTMTSPSVSFTSSTVTSPIGSIQGENTTKSPKATSGYRRSDRNKSYAGYREDYVRKQKEKLCGRKSLDERLKSLELGASVQLQVCKGSQNRRRKSSEHDMVLTSKPQNENFSNVTSRSRSLSPSHILENDDNLMEKEMQIEPTPSRPPPPDIIESHQPPGGVTQDSSENFETSQHNDGVPLRLTQPLDDVQAMQSEVFFESATTDLQVDLDSPKAERKHHPVAIKWKVATPPISRKTSYDLEAERDLQRNSAKLSLDKSNANNYDIINDITPTSVEVVNADPLSQNEKETSSPPTVNTPVSLVCLPDGKDVSEITKNVTRRDGPLQRRGAPAPLILDVATDNAVVPVELRSPRAEGGGFGRAVMREKRNARVFTLPSSDDSESDNLLSKINKPVENRSVHIAPVKFVPSVLRRSRSRSAAKEDVSHSSSTSSIATDNKTTNADETKQQISSAPKESRRKSSRSPKRSSSKRSNRSKSTHDRPSTDRPTGDQGKSSRRLSSGSHSPVSVANSNSDRLSRQPSEQRSQRSNQRSKEKSSRSPHTRHKTEYNELTNVKRSHRKVMEASSLPSPRQQAVAHAVKFGFSRNEGAIPYIDEATSPEENKKFKVDEMRRRAASDGALLHEADSATIRRALPLSRRGRSSSRKEGPRRTSYMEAMESSDDLTPDPDTDGSIYSIVRTDSGKESRIAVSKFGRSTSADSILSITDVPTKVVLRKNTRSSSADRNSLKGVHRRSYQIATKPTNDALLRTPPHKRQPSIRKLKNFFGENTPQIVEAQADESRRGSRGRSLAPPPTLDLNEYDDSVVREGFLYFKVATIEKGKRTSSQKSWKLIWVVLKEQSLYLCKDWTRNKPDAPLVAPGATPGSNPGPPIGAGQPPSQLTLEEEEPLNIQGSLVSIAYNYVKRRNVFKVTTCNGSEYLLQADDRDDMLTWITSIQVSGNHDNAGGEATINEDLILRKTSQIESGPKPDKKTTRKSRSPKPVRRITVPIKDIDGSRRFKWRGSVNRIVRKFGQGQTLMQGGTFDVHLEDCPPSPNNECIPFVVELCCRIVEERGLSFTGIYRVPGNSGTLVALQEELNIRGPEAVDLENDERFCELNVVSSLLKSFFRKLPDPLFTNELYDDFISMNRKKESEERLNGLRRLIHMLPAPHYETLKFLITHLRRVADNCDVNKMEVRNLAIVFGPTLVRSTISDNMATMVTDMSDQCRIVESVLQHTPWFFNDDEIPGAEVKPAPVPSEVQHEPVPNIDHLLANVGRTPGDVSDSTSDSSKSKTSVASEKESFSRDVMEMIFGAGKRWLQNQQETNKMKEKEEEDSSDDEFGFKQAERNLARATEQRMKTPPKSPASTTSSTKYQVAKPAASGIRAGWPSKGQHLPHDIPARLYDFYVENLERLARTDVTRPLPNFSSSSTDTSPQVTPRSSLFGPPQPQRSYPMQVRRSSDLRLQNGAPEHPDNTSRQYNVPPSSPPQKPRIYGVSPQNQRYCKKPSEFQSVLATSTPLRMNDDRRLQPTRGQNESELSTISKEGCHGDEDSDSDTSIYVGDTLEEKLKNLTNLDKKLERRPSRRYANRPPQDVMVKVPPAPSKPVVKKLTAPSRKAGELITPDNVHMFPAKKTSKELYQERKAQRMQHRVLVKATRGNRKETNLARCASDENVFNRCDPKRQMIRSGAHDDVTNHRARPSQERVRRRHTLGGNDFPGQEFWDKSVYASLQNITQDAPAGSAMARLRPKLGASDPSVTLQPQTARLLGYVGSWRTDKGRKTESYL